MCGNIFKTKSLLVHHIGTKHGKVFIKLLPIQLLPAPFAPCVICRRNEFCFRSMMCLWSWVTRPYHARWPVTQRGTPRSNVRSWSWSRKDSGSRRRPPPLLSSNSSQTIMFHLGQSLSGTFLHAVTSFDIFVSAILLVRFWNKQMAHKTNRLNSIEWPGTYTWVTYFTWFTWFTCSYLDAFPPRILFCPRKYY